MNRIIEVTETTNDAIDRIIATNGRMTVPQALMNSMNSGILISFLNRPNAPWRTGLLPR